MSRVQTYTEEFLLSLLVVIQVILTAVVFIVGDDWKGDKSGASLRPTTRYIAISVSWLLVFSVGANFIMIVYKLFWFPKEVNSSDEISLTAAAISVLWWTDVLTIRRRVRRRRQVALLATRFPTFRFGKGSKGSPTPQMFMTSEIVIRSANYDIFKQVRKAEKEYFRGRITKFYSSEYTRNGKGGSLVVLHDEAAQDEAGADLLTSNFTHVAELHKQNVADVVFKMIVRSGLWNLNHWDKGFSAESLHILKKIRGVKGMMEGELWHNISANYGLKGFFQKIEAAMSDSRIPYGKDAKELCHVYWAAICEEIFYYLEKKNKKPVLLTVFAEIPLEIKSAVWSLSSIIRACKQYEKSRNESYSH